MAKPIFIIRSDIRHVHDGARVDPPGARFLLPGPLTAATAHTQHNTHTNHRVNKIHLPRKLNILSSCNHSLVQRRSDSGPDPERCWSFYSPKVSREAQESLP